jgi:hypothetical protein
MKDKVCACCKNEIFANSINSDELYVIRTEWYDHCKGLDRYDDNFYVKCRDCNSLIEITTEEMSEILNNCGYECEHYRYPLNFSETGWKDDYPNNFKQVDYHSGFNPNDIFKIKVELNISDDIISKLDNVRKYLNDIQTILNDNSADKKCQNAYDQLHYHILYDFDSFERNVKEIVKENLKNICEKPILK